VDVIVAEAPTPTPRFAAATIKADTVGAGVAALHHLLEDAPSRPALRAEAVGGDSPSQPTAAIMGRRCPLLPSAHRWPRVVGRMPTGGPASSTTVAVLAPATP